MATPACIGRFVVEAELGRGGMGVVYRALDPISGARVAVKVLLHAEAEDLLRFEREARLLAQASHPAVVSLLELGREQGGRPFVALELVEGESLAARLARGPLEPRAAARLLEPVARALAHAHARGVVHRDVKPENVLIDRDGRAKLSDFGLARRTDAGASRLTATGMILGTPAYMAPEQAAGEPADGRADVWGLGATLHAAVTGAPPFGARAGVLDNLRAVLEDPVVAPSDRGVELPADVEEVLMTCLARDPARRFATADALADALAAAARPPAAPRPERRRRLGPALLAGGALLAGAALLGGAALALRPTPEPPAGPPAQEPGPTIVEASPPEEPDLAALRAAAEEAERGGWPYDAALAAWEALAAGHDDAHAWARVARLRRRTGAHPMAADATARALAIDPGEPLALVEDGYRRYNENDVDRAAARVKAALAAAPDHPDALALAAALARAGLAGQRATDDDLARVRAPAERALALDPSQVEAAIVVAITLPPDDEESVRRAVAILDRALDGAPGHPLLLGQRGRLRSTLGQLAGAQDDLARATTRLPDDPAFAVEHALVLARLEEDDLAIVAQDRAMDLGAERPELLASRLETLVRRRELARALADGDLFLRLAGREEPGLVARVHLLRGMACHLSGEAEAALADARRAIALAGHPLAHALGIWARLERDDVAGALAAAEEVVQRYPRLPEALASRARARLAAGQVSDALADTERAVASRVVTPQVRTVHAAALLAAGRTAEATAAARVACDAAGPRAIEARLVLGQALARGGEAAAAREALLEVVRGVTSPRLLAAREAWDGLAALTPPDPAEAAAHEARARALAREGRPAEALAAWQEALLRAPTAARWMALATFARRHAPHADWADAAFARALALEPGFPPARAAEALLARRAPDPDLLAAGLPDAVLAQGVAAYVAGDTATALEQAERALAADPEHIEARLAAATLLTARARQDGDAAALRRAAALLDEALALDPACASTLDRRGAVRLAAGDLGGALADLRRAAALAPTVHEAAATLAAALEEAGAHEEAADAWRRATVLDRADAGAMASARRALCLHRAGRAAPARGAALTALRRAIALPADQAAQVRAALEPLDAEVRRALGQGR